MLIGGREGGGYRIKKVAVVVLALTLLAISCAVAPVLAIGPTKAAKVGHNPNVGINPTTQKTYLNTPNVKSGLDRITWLDNQMFLYKNVSNVKGMMNNAIIADINTVEGMVSNLGEYENKWIYLSGENGDHGMFYYWITSSVVGFPADQAEASILARNPDGGYVKTNYVGRP